MRPIIIHAKGLCAIHIPRSALRSSIDLLVTCKHCQRMKGFPTMTVTDVQRMVSIVRAIKKGKWTEELPPWAMNSFLHKITFDVSSNTRAVQTAEAFLILLHAANYPMKDATFLRDCGFPS